MTSSTSTYTSSFSHHSFELPSSRNALQSNFKKGPSYYICSAPHRETISSRGRLQEFKGIIYLVRYHINFILSLPPRREHETRCLEPRSVQKRGCHWQESSAETALAFAGRPTVNLRGHREKQKKSIKPKRKEISLQIILQK